MLLKLIKFNIKGLLLLQLTLFCFGALASQEDLPDLLSGQYEVRKNPKGKPNRTLGLSSGLGKNKIRSPAMDELEKSKKSNETPVSLKSGDVSITTPIEESARGLATSPDSHLQVAEPTLSEQFNSLFHKESNPVLDYYNERIHPDDIRNNRLEFDIHSIYTDIKAKSPYSFRQFDSQFAGFDLGTNVWITPGLGFTSRISYSIAASIPNSSTTNVNSLAKFEDLEFGFKFRKFFGPSRRANYFETNLLLQDSKINVLADDSQRMRLKTNGLALLLSVFIPTSPHWTHHFSMLFAPRLAHTEASTGIEAFSGSPGDSTRFGFAVGSELKFSRENQVLLDLGIFTEKNQFTGQTQMPDQNTNANLNNIAVATTTATIRMGYRWGK